MKIPFVGPSATARSPNANAQRAINVYLEVDQGNQRAPLAMYGMPGLTLRATLAAGGHRGAIESDGYGYYVAGNHIYRVDSAYTVVDCGAITTSTGRVGIATNGTEVMVVDGVKGWLVTGTLLSEIIDPDFPNGVTGVVYLDSYFVVFGDGSQQFAWSENPNSGVAWNGLDIASAEGSPDDIVGGVADHRQLWFIGSDSGEVFDNVGDADAPFQRSGSTFIQQGTVSAWTVERFDNSVVWLSRNEDGQGIFLKSQGGNPVRFSDHYIETAMAGYSTLSDAYAYTFQMFGHSFYVVSFPTADATWAFDAASGQWTEWLWRKASDNTLHRHRSASHVFVGGKHLVGDWETGKVFSLETDVHSDNGDAILRLRRSQSMRADGKRMFFGRGQIDMETGVATAECPEPTAMLRYFDEGSHNPSGERQIRLGAVGEYHTRVRFGPTGASYDRSWELSMTDPVKFAVFGADVEVKQGR